MQMIANDSIGNVSDTYVYLCSEMAIKTHKGKITKVYTIDRDQLSSRSDNGNKRSDCITIRL